MNQEIESGVSLSEKLMGKGDYVSHQDDLIENALTVDGGTAFVDLDDNEKVGLVIAELDPDDRESVKDDGQLVTKIDLAKTVAEGKLSNLGEDSYKDWQESEERRVALVKKLQEEDSVSISPVERVAWVNKMKKDIERERVSTAYGRGLHDITKLDAAKEIIGRHYGEDAKKKESREEGLAA